MAALFVWTYHFVRGFTTDENRKYLLITLTPLRPIELMFVYANFLKIDGPFNIGKENKNASNKKKIK